MAELKTRLNDRSVERFLNSVPDRQKRQDCFTLDSRFRGSDAVVDTTF